MIPSLPVGAPSGDGYTVMADDAPVAVDAGRPGRRAGEVRDRVNRSVAYTAHHPAAAAAGYGWSPGGCPASTA